MAFKTVTDLGTETAISLGGRDKKTGKENPKSITGYFLGSRDVASKFSSTGLAKMHVFQTPKGNIGVFGKTDLDRKLGTVTPGAMTRVTQNGSVPTNKGNDMLKFQVEVDLEDVIDVSAPDAVTSDRDSGTEETYEDDVDQLPEPVRTAPRAPDASQKARVQALLNRK